MRTLHNAPIEAALVAIVGLATVAVVVSSRAHTADVITSFGTGLSRLIAAAISPITGTSGLQGFTSQGFGASGLQGSGSSGLQGFSGTGTGGTGSLGTGSPVGTGQNSSGFSLTPGGAISPPGTGSPLDYLLTPASPAPASDFANEVPYDNAGLYIDGGTPNYAGAEITVQSK